MRLWARDHVSRPVAIIGHSMGGLVAMGFALAYPEITEKIVVVDVAPRMYPLDHE